MAVEENTITDKQAHSAAEPPAAAKKEASPEEPEKQREEVAKRVSIMEMIRNLFRNLFGNRKEEEPTKKEATPEGKEDIKANLLGEWDSLTDDSNTLKQRFDNTLNDLVNTEPQEPEGVEASNPAAMAAYHQSLQEHHKKIERAEQSYTNDITELQQRRDEILKVNEDVGVTDIDPATLDAQLGTEGDGPGHSWLKNLKNESLEQIEYAGAKVATLSAAPGVGTGGPQSGAVDNEGGDLVTSDQKRKLVMGAVGNLIREARESYKETGEYSPDMERIQSEINKLSAPEDDAIDQMSAREVLEIGVNLDAKESIVEAVERVDPDDNDWGRRFAEKTSRSGCFNSPSSDHVRHHSTKGKINDPEQWKQDFREQEADIDKKIAALPDSFREHSAPSSTPSAMSM